MHDLRWPCTVLLCHSNSHQAFTVSQASMCVFSAMAELESSWSAGGCALCASPDFQRDGFGPNTVLICDQCEREFHVGCLKQADMADLQALPEGE